MKIFDKKSISLLSIMPYLFALLFGIVLGVLIRDFPFIAFKREVSIAEISGLTLTVFVAIFVPFYLDKKINNKRFEKDILIGHCAKIDSELYALRDFVDSQFTEHKLIKKNNADKILVITRRISNMLDSLRTSVSVYNDDKQINDVLAALIDNNNDFRANLTFHLKDNRPRITNEAYLQAENDFNMYSGNLTKLILRINNV